MRRPRSRVGQASYRAANCAAAGLPLCPARCRIAGTSGSDTKLCQPSASQSKMTQTRSSSDGSRKTSALLEPCSLRFSATFRGEDLQEAIHVLDLRGREQHHDLRSFGGCRSVRRKDLRVHEAFLRIHRPEVLDDFEPAAAGLADVHAHPHVVLPGHHGRGAAGTLGDLRVIQRGDHVVLRQRPGFLDGGRPQLQAAIEARGPAAAGELRVARIQRVVLGEQPPAERVADRVVVVEAAVQAVDVRGRQRVEQVLLEVRADQLPPKPESCSCARNGATPGGTVVLKTTSARGAAATEGAAGEGLGQRVDALLAGAHANDAVDAA